VGDRYETKVVVGAANAHFDTLAEAHPLARLERNVTEMAKLMAWADIAISASGSTVWELLFMRLPSLLVVTADNQIPIAREVVRRGTAALFDGRSSLERLGSSISERRAMATSGRALVDGRGAERVCAFLTGEDHER
jgi:spore coat polysaccharide biosynthesis predicted glycosyltransferase SpsG